MNKVENVLLTRRYLITGAKRTSNYWWALIVSLGGLAFLITGFASFLQKGILLFNQSKSISFLPQGLIMCFYGSLGLLFGFYLWCTIIWKVGDGFNEFNQTKGFVRIFRWGLPGKNRLVDFQYNIDEIEGVRVELKEGVNPRRVISLKMKGTDRREPFPRKGKQNKSARQLSIGESWSSSASEKSTPNRSTKSLQRDAFLVPLTRVGQPISLEKIESQASELAQFLRVSLESRYLDS